MKRRNHNSAFKAKIGLEALAERETLQSLAKKHALLPNQISQWKLVIKERSHELFEGKSEANSNLCDLAIKDELYRQIGVLKVELDFVKKKLGQL